MLSVPLTQVGQAMSANLLSGKHSRLRLFLLKSDSNLFHLLPALHWKSKVSPCEVGLEGSQAVMGTRLESSGGEGSTIHFAPEGGTTNDQFSVGSHIDTGP